MERNIILDCDCVIFDFYKGVHSAAEKALQREVLENKGIYDLRKRFSLTENELVLVNKTLYSDFDQFTFLDGAMEAFKMLKDYEINIHLVTGIPEELSSLRWKNFQDYGLQPDSIHCVGDGHHDKSSTIQQYYQPIALADDRIQHLYDVRNITQHRVWINNGDDQKGYEDKKHYITHEHTSLKDWVTLHPEIFEVPSPRRKLKF